MSPKLNFSPFFFFLPFRPFTSFAFFTGSDCESRACDKSSRWCYQTEWILISEQMTRVVIRILMNLRTINPWLCQLGVRDWEVIVNERKTIPALCLKIMTIRDVKLTTKVRRLIRKWPKWDFNSVEICWVSISCARRFGLEMFCSNRIFWGSEITKICFY